jgi:hypothetical protein
MGIVCHTHVPVPGTDQASLRGPLSRELFDPGTLSRVSRDGAWHQRGLD